MKNTEGVEIFNTVQEWLSEERRVPIIESARIIATFVGLALAAVCLAIFRRTE